MESKKQNKLMLHSVLGYNGTVCNGLLTHPNGKDYLYPISSVVVIMNKVTMEQRFLRTDMTGKITALTISKTGKYVAVGYLPYPGFKALIIVWNFESGVQLKMYESHKDKVHSIKFTNCEDYVISLGGFNDENNVICYSLGQMEIYCGCNAVKGTSGLATVLELVGKGNMFVTGGECTIRLWKLGCNNKILEYSDVSFSKFKRTISCISFNESAFFLYCGTNSGDIMKVKLKSDGDSVSIQSPVMYGCHGKKIRSQNNYEFTNVARFHLGINVLRIFATGVLVGCGDGTIEILEEQSLDKVPVYKADLNKLVSPTLPTFVKKKSINIKKKITSLCADQNCFIIGTDDGDMMSLQPTDFILSNVYESFKNNINDIVFPCDFSEVFMTCCNNAIQIWKLSNLKLLLEIYGPELSICSGLAISRSGDYLVSIWNDGSIRIHTPVSGTLVCIQEKGHSKEGTVAAITPNGNIIITGGNDGEVNFWKFEDNRLVSLSKQKHHRGLITSIHIDADGEKVATTGNEGLCIVWSVKDLKKLMIICCLTICNSVRFHPNGKDLITAGNDGKIRIWSTTNGLLTNEIESSRFAVNCFDVSNDGKFYITVGGNLKIWSYDSKHKLLGEEDCWSKMQKVRISPNDEYVTAINIDKTVVLWKLI